MSSPVLVSRPDERGAVSLTLDRPEKRNALSIDVRERVSNALKALAGDPAVKCVVLEARGSTFCAGFDIAEFAVDLPSFQQRLWGSSDRYHQAVLRFPVPLVAAVNGPALGGGFDLALMCDIRIAAETAVFGHPEQKFGDVAYSLLHAAVGGAVARDLSLTGREITAAEALRLRLVSSVVPRDELTDAVSAMVTQICRAPREFLKRTKLKAIARANIPDSVRTLDL